eukprot:gnl/TRDRNA2_/TRDRNA2_81172_c0_seq1.p1 gnl/TRDRNA2_/TRDRNA2_81172_c0~~gnl/TRDRNA2_/TRDRNA2_81172_c0_seq1.p1  ORF type:complete len:942 (-),score=255.16 gnl/TRDRNA2_/TRDRNA2_81172_c0_seq1:56-2881(-)
MQSRRRIRSQPSRRQVEDKAKKTEAAARQQQNEEDCYHGTVKCVGKKFGWIECPKLYAKHGRDVFVGASELRTCGLSPETIKAHMEVTFRVRLDDGSAPEAVDITAKDKRKDKRNDTDSGAELEAEADRLEDFKRRCQCTNHGAVCNVRRSKPRSNGSRTRSPYRSVHRQAERIMAALQLNKLGNAAVKTLNSSEKTERKRPRRTDRKQQVEGTASASEASVNKALDAIGSYIQDRGGSVPAPEIHQKGLFELHRGVILDAGGLKTFCNAHRDRLVWDDGDGSSPASIKVLDASSQQSALKELCRFIEKSSSRGAIPTSDIHKFYDQEPRHREAISAVGGIKKFCRAYSDRLQYDASGKSGTEEIKLKGFSSRKEAAQSDAEDVSSADGEAKEHADRSGASNKMSPPAKKRTRGGKGRKKKLDISQLPVSSEWDCAACGFKNHTWLPYCEVCESRREDDPLAMPMRRQADSSDSRRKGKFDGEQRKQRASEMQEEKPESPRIVLMPGKISQKKRKAMLKALASGMTQEEAVLAATGKNGTISLDGKDQAPDTDHFRAGGDKAEEQVAEQEPEEDTRKENAHEDNAYGDDAREDDAGRANVCDGQEDAGEDEANEDEEPEDEAPEDEAPEDDAPEDEAPEDEAGDNEVHDDEASENEAHEDEDDASEDDAGDDDAYDDDVSGDDAREDDECGESARRSNSRRNYARRDEEDQEGDGDEDQEEDDDDNDDYFEEQSDDDDDEDDDSEDEDPESAPSYDLLVEKLRQQLRSDLGTFVSSRLTDEQLLQKKMIYDVDKIDGTDREQVLQLLEARRLAEKMGGGKRGDRKPAYERRLNPHFLTGELDRAYDKESMRYRDNLPVKVRRGVKYVAEHKIGAPIEEKKEKLSKEERTMLRTQGLTTQDRSLMVSKDGPGVPPADVSEQTVEKKRIKKRAIEGHSAFSHR